MKEPYTFYPLFIYNMNLPWKDVLHLGIQVKYGKKQIISDGMDNTVGFYYLNKGKVRVSYIAECGSEKNVLFIGEGTLCNEIPSLSFGHSNAILTSMDNIELYFFSKDNIFSREFMSDYPYLIKNLIGSLSLKACILFSQACNLGLFDAFQNVCRVLYGMAIFSEDKARIVPQLSQQDIASFVGIHRGSLHKILRRLKDEGVIGIYSRHSLTVLDMDKLHYYASSNSE